MKLVSFPQKRPALAFSDYLSSINIANRVEEDGDAYAILLQDEADFPAARQELEGFLTAPEDPRYWHASWQSGQTQQDVSWPAHEGAFSAWWQRAGIVTRSVTLLCVLVFVLLNAAPQSTFDLLSYPEFMGNAGLHAEWWRLLSPALMHFGFMHVAFNLLWWWELGGLIERGQSGMRLLAISVVVALLSNAAQGLQYGPKFGGLSGVIYGLLGYLWMYPVFNPSAGFRLRKEILWFMLGWLAIGYTGVLDVIFGPVSNTGHSSGLLAGMALGMAVGWVNRGQVTRGLPGD